LFIYIKSIEIESPDNIFFWFKEEISRYTTLFTSPLSLLCFILLDIWEKKNIFNSHHKYYNYFKIFIIFKFNHHVNFIFFLKILILIIFILMKLFFFFFIYIFVFFLFQYIYIYIYIQIIIQIIINNFLK